MVTAINLSPSSSTEGVDEPTSLMLARLQFASVGLAGAGEKIPVLLAQSCADGEAAAACRAEAVAAALSRVLGRVLHRMVVELGSASEP